MTKTLTTIEPMKSEALYFFPSYIDVNVYIEFSELVFQNPDKIYLILFGNGGFARVTDAICSLIMHHGNVEAHLVGDAASCHVRVFSVCQTRYTYPLATISLHPSYITGGDDKYDQRDLNSAYLDLKKTDENALKWLEKASNKPISWWKKRYFRSSYLNTLDAKTMIEVGIAEPVPQNMKAKLADVPRFKPSGRPLPESLDFIEAEQDS